MTVSTSPSAAAAYPTDPRAVLRRLLPFVAIVFCGMLSIGIPLPVLPAQVHGALGFGTVVVGWVIGIQSIATVLTRQYAGLTCDRRGVKTAVLLGLPAAVLAGLMNVAAALLPVDATGSLAILLAGRLLLGIAESLFLTGAMTWAIATVGVQNTGRVMAWQGIAIFAALGLGAPAGLWLLDRFGFVIAAAVAAGVPLPALAIVVFRRGIAPMAGGPRVPFWRVLGLIWQPGMALGLAAMSFGALAAFVTLYYAAHGWSGAGFALSGFAGGYILVRLFFAGLPDRLGGARVGLVSLAVQAAGQGLMFSAGSPLMALIGATVTGLGFSLVYPSMGVEAIRRVAPQSRGIAVGGYNAFFDLSLGVAGPVMGLIAAGFGYPAVFLSCGVAALVAMVLAATLKPAAA
ncbi:MFS transporter [Ferrovibrio sp.]|uniref:MFS transporter n=1 Tax=Ferrovibrio sp. TaxID=1917215 RepID=UPI003517B04D